MSQTSIYTFTVHWIIVNDHLSVKMGMLNFYHSTLACDQNAITDLFTSSKISDTS